jgi:hypothetical protein
MPLFAVYKWLLGDTDADDIENADIGALALAAWVLQLSWHIHCKYVFLLLIMISLTCHTALAFIIFGIFTVLVTVLMLNVLVAMFNKYVYSIRLLCFAHLPSFIIN